MAASKAPVVDRVFRRGDAKLPNGAGVGNGCRRCWVPSATLVCRLVARILPTCTLVALTLSCAGGRNYVDPRHPRYAAPVPASSLRDTLHPPASIRVVTYNVAFSRDVEGAIGVLRATSLQAADVVLLQEMTAEATARIASALGMGFVYYPAIHHRRAKQEFGNAVLSRWPIVDDAKLILPHRSRYARTQRTATAVTIRVGQRRIRVYSTHLGTVADISGGQRQAQLATILADGAGHADVLVGGDMNMSDLGDAPRRFSFAWPTERIGATTRFGAWDHLLARGLCEAAPCRTGVVGAGYSASDHVAVWMVVPLRS